VILGNVDIGSNASFKGFALGDGASANVNEGTVISSSFGIRLCT